MTDAFVSYSRRDLAFVRRLGDALVAAGRDIWVDWEDIPPTADWLARIHEGIDGADAFVFVLSPDSVASVVCGRELAHAVEHGKRIVPVVHRRTPDADVPPELARLNWIDLSDPGAFDHQVGVLLEVLDTDLAWVQGHTRRLTQAIEWEQRGQDRSLLLRGRELEAAEAWMRSGADQEPRPTQLQIAYLQASRRGAARRQRTLLAGVTTALVVSLVLGALALVSRDEARRQEQVAQEQARLATSRALSASAALVLDQDPELSLMLARRALATMPTDQAIDATRTALVSSQVRATIDAGEVTRADLSADHRWALTVDPTGAARTWRAEDGAEAGRLPDLLVDTDGGLGDTTRTQAAFSPRDDRILAVTAERAAVLIDPSDGAVIARFGPEGSVSTATWGTDGQEVAVGRDDGTVTVHQTSSPRAEVRVRVGDAPVYSVALAADGRTLAASTLDPASSRTTAGVWDLPSGDRRSDLAQPAEAGFGLTVLLAAAGEGVVTQSRSAATTLWSTSSGRPVAVLSSASSGAVAVSGDGSLVAVGELGGPVRVADASTGAPITTFDGHGPGQSIGAVAFSPSGVVLSAGTDRRVLVWDPRTGDRLGDLRGLPGPAIGLEVSADGRRVVTASTDGARVWNPGQILSTLDLAGSGGALTPDGRSVVVAGPDGLDVVAAGTGELRHHLADPSDDLYRVGLSADGSTAWTATDDAIEVYAVGDGRREARFAHPDGFAVNPGVWAASTDGGVVAASFFASDGGGSALVVHERGRAEAVTVPVASTDSIALSADGRRLAVGSGGAALLVDPRTGRRLHTVRAKADASSAAVAFSPDGSRVAVSGDELVAVFDVASGRQVGPGLTAPDQVVLALAFSPDGRRLAAGAATGTDVWDLDGSRLVLALASDDQVAAVRWSADGRFLLTDDFVRTRTYLASGERTQEPLTSLPGNAPTQSADGRWILTVDGEVVRLWPCDACQGPEALLALAAERTTRPFTVGERRRYLID